MTTLVGYLAYRIARFIVEKIEESREEKRSKYSYDYR
jgi:hypothetical protein